MSHPRWYENDACCEHESTQHCNCRAYYPARKPIKKQVGDILFREDNDMRSTKSPIREPKNQTYEFPTEMGDFQVFPVYGGCVSRDQQRHDMF